MFKAVVILAYVAMTACAGIGEIPVPTYDVDPEFDTYIKVFEAEAKLRGKSLTIKNLIARFGYTKYDGDDVIGLCSKSKYSPVVVIDREYWDRVGTVDREILFFHELGHCILKLPHDNSMVDFDRYQGPASVMNEYMFDSWIYVTNRHYYMNELFRLAN